MPKGALHTYKILETFTAVEATSPPAEVGPGTSRTVAGQHFILFLLSAFYAANWD
jgi:hypothetical protein